MPLSAHAVRWKFAAPVAFAFGCFLTLSGAPPQTGTQSTRTTGSGTDPSNGGRPGYNDPRSTSSFDTDVFRDNDPSLRVTRMNARRDELKKRMQQNATRLLLLTAELHNDLETREPTEADGKRLEEIARLAHAVREQMKQ